MTDQQQTKLMVQNLINKFDEHCEYTKKELGEIKRGVYGDPANKVLGLIDRQEIDERRLALLEEERKREQLQKKTILWVIGIIFTAVQAVGIAVWEFFKSFK
jgi:hypothetical protein